MRITSPLTDQPVGRWIAEEFIYLQTIYQGITIIPRFTLPQEFRNIFIRVSLLWYLRKIQDDVFFKNKSKMMLFYRNKKQTRQISGHNLFQKR